MKPRQTLLPTILAASLVAPAAAAAQTRPPPKDPPPKAVVTKDVAPERPAPKDPPPKPTPPPKPHESVLEQLEDVVSSKADRQDPGDPRPKGHASTPVKTSPD